MKTKSPRIAVDAEPAVGRLCQRVRQLRKEKARLQDDLGTVREAKALRAAITEARRILQDASMVGWDD